MSLILSGTDGLSDVDGSASTPAIRGTDTNTGIFFPAADTIAFAEGGAEVARFDSSGNLGIGTTTAPAGGLLTLNRAPTAAFGSPILQVGGASFTSGGYYSVGLGFTDATYTEPPAEIAYVPTSDSGGTKGAIVFGTRDVTTNTAVSERMRIDSGGRVQIGTTATTPASSNTFGVVINDNGSGTPYLGVIQASSNGNSALNLNRGGDNGNTVLFRQAGTLVGTISVTGSATAYNTSSDYRLKENIEPMTGALATVQALKPVTYTWKSTGEASQGFIAHELAEVVPDAVNGEKDAVNEDGTIKAQGIDTSFLVATLTAAIQELKAELDSVKAELATLKA